MRHPNRIFLAAAVLLAVATASPAQCFVNDAFSIPGACCTVVPNPNNLPAFPATSMAAEGACFHDCNVESVFSVSILVGVPIQVFTDLYAAVLDINGTVNTSPTFMVMKYARTWEEVDSSGAPARQVWRFLVNADLPYVTTGPTPCPVPACAVAGMRVHVVGSIDYARDCANPSQWSTVLNLTHLCGAFSHGPTSSRPTTTAHHPGRTFSFVGPAPFNFFAPQPSPQGGAMVGDSARATHANLPTSTWDTYSELDVTLGHALLVNNYCPCATGPGPQRWEAINLRFDYGCGIPTDVLLPFPWLPHLPTGLSAFPLGRYLHGPGSFASDKAVSVYTGVAAGTDPCAGNFPFHFVHGVGFTGGDWAFIQNSPVLTDRLIDLANSLTLIAPPPFLQTGHGSLFLSTMIWSGAVI